MAGRFWTPLLVSLVVGCTAPNEPGTQGALGGQEGGLGGAGGGSGGAAGGASGDAGQGGAGTAGAAGHSGSGGTGAGLERLGASCERDADCAGLRCFTKDGADFSGEGFPGGLCSLDCAADESVCGARGVCVGLGEGTARRVCVERCQLRHAPTLPLEHQDVCHGRWDVGCVVAECVDDRDFFLCIATAFDARRDEGQCLPACHRRTDCSGRACDLRTGLCADVAREGLANGEGCDPTKGPDPCAGSCGRLGPDPTVGICQSRCVEGFGSGTCMTSPVPGEFKEQSCVSLLPGGLGVCQPNCDCAAPSCPEGASCVINSRKKDGFPYADGCGDDRLVAQEYVCE